jgi:hypothetical protein
MLGKYIKNIKRGVCKEAAGPHLHMGGRQAGRRPPSDVPQLDG